MDDLSSINSEKLKRMKALHVAFILLDVRAKNKFEEKHIEGAFHLDPDEFLKKIEIMVPEKSAPIIIYDEEGQVAPGLVLKAFKMGFINILFLEGGFQAYSS